MEGEIEKKKDDEVELREYKKEGNTSPTEENKSEKKNPRKKRKWEGTRNGWKGKLMKKGR